MTSPAQPPAWKLKRDFHPLKCPDFLQKKDFVVHLGRDKRADIQCESDNVSRIHCRIEYNGANWTISDLKSLNGTFVNNVMIESGSSVILKDRDHIGLSIGVPESDEEKGPKYFTFSFEGPPVQIKKEKDSDDEIEILAEFSSPVKPNTSKIEIDISNSEEKRKPSNPTATTTATTTTATTTLDNQQGYFKSNESKKALLESETVEKVQLTEEAKEKLKRAFEQCVINLKNKDAVTPTTIDSPTIKDSILPSTSKKIRIDRKVQEVLVQLEKEHPQTTSSEDDSSDGLGVVSAHDVDIEVVGESKKKKIVEVYENELDGVNCDDWEEDDFEETNNENNKRKADDVEEFDNWDEDSPPRKKKKRDSDSSSDKTDFSSDDEKNAKIVQEKEIKKERLEAEKKRLRDLRDEKIERIRQKNLEMKKTKIKQISTVHLMGPGRRGNIGPSNGVLLQPNSRQKSKTLNLNMPSTSSSTVTSPRVIPRQNSRNQNFLNDLLNPPRPMVSRKTAASPTCEIINQNTAAGSGATGKSISAEGVHVQVKVVNVMEKIKEDADRITKMMKPGVIAPSTSTSRLLIEGVKRPNGIIKSADQMKIWHLEEHAYKDLYIWKPDWIMEQELMEKASNYINKRSPPVNNDRPVRVAMKDYIDFEVYQGVFYPLLLFELWGSIIQEYRNTRSSPHYNKDSLEFDVGIEKIEYTFDCPFFDNRQRQRFDKKKKKFVPPKKDCYWHQVKVMGFSSKRNPFDKRLDLVVLTVKRKAANCTTPTVVDPNSKEPPSKFRDKKVFGVILPNSERVEEILPFSSNLVHPKAFNARPENERQFKISFTIVTHFNNFDPDLEIEVDEICRVEKISYVSSYIRVFKNLSILPQSPLFNKVLHPKHNSEKMDFSKAPAPSTLVEYVNKLNPTQKTIVYHITTRISTKDPEFMLLHGPPGTGKTKTIVGIVTQLLKQHASSEINKVKILICTPSNLALDEIITRLDFVLKDFAKKPLMVRIGTEGDSDLVRKYSMESICKKRFEESSVIDSFTKSIRQEEEKKEALMKKINDAKAAQGFEVILGGMYQELRELQTNIDKYKKELKTELSGKNNHMGEEKSVILRCANIICGTLSSITSHSVSRPLLHEEFTCCIIDEATQATEPETLAPLMFRGIKKLVLVGDPHQLPATIISHEAKQKDFDLSLFRRHFDYHENREMNPVMALIIQYRMHPEIIKWPNDNFYKGMLKTATSVLEDGNRKLRICPYLFINLPSKESGHSGKISNAKEVELIISFLQTLELQEQLDKNHKNLSIGIITPYQEQRRILHQALNRPENKISSKFRESIEANTVDSFQGKEKDIILMSCVRTGELGFLKAKNRLNVALTRARLSQIIIGCADSLNSDPMWKSLIDDAKRRFLFKSIPDNYTEYNHEKLRRFIEKLILIDTKSEIPDESRGPNKLSTNQLY